MNSDSNQPGNAKGSIIPVALLVIVIAILGLVAWRIHSNRVNKVAKNQSTISTVSSSNASTPSTATSDKPVITSDQSATNDLQGINSSLGQDSTNINSTNSAVNDQQSEISVPSN